MKHLAVLLFILVAFQVMADERYLVPVKKEQLPSINASGAYKTYETVCVQENCYYVVDKDTAEQMVKGGIAESYEAVAERHLSTTEETKDGKAIGTGGCSMMESSENSFLAELIIIACFFAYRRVFV